MAASEELALVVIVSVKAGKGETVSFNHRTHEGKPTNAMQFLKLSEEAYDRFWPKEPGCLQFQIHRNIDGVQDGEERFALVERYPALGLCHLQLQLSI